MRCRRLTVLIPLAALAPPLWGQSADSLRHRFDVMATEMYFAHASIPECTDQTSPAEFAKLLAALAKEQDEQRTLGVKVDASLTSDDSPEASNADRLSSVSSLSSSLQSTQDHAANLGLQLTRGTYPGELSFSTEVGLTLDDDTNGFRENISRVRVSYDHYFVPTLEGYVFFNRLSNDFLSINQRYEAGLGLVLDVYPLERDLPLVGVGEKTRDDLEPDPYFVSDTAWARARAANEKPRPAWLDCFVKTRLRMEGFRARDVANYDPSNTGASPRPLARAWASYEAEGKKAAETVYKEVEDARHSNIKRHARLRPALLVGLDTEFEQATIKVALEDSTKLTIPLRGTQTYRLVVRPTLVLRVNEFIRLRADWYRMYRIAGSNGRPLGGRDIRQDLRISGTVDGNLSGIGKLSVTLEFRRLHDNAPPFIDLAGSTVAGGVTLDERLLPLLEDGPIFARRRHDRVQLKVGVTF